MALVLTPRLGQRPCQRWRSGGVRIVTLLPLYLAVFLYSILLCIHRSRGASEVVASEALYSNAVNLRRKTAYE